MPTIGTIIPVWNRSDSLRQAVDSALWQDLPEGWAQEILIVDDGSTIDIAEVVRPYEEQVILIRHDANAGAAQARNTGIAATKGEYIAFLDSDDEWHPGKLAAQIEFMRGKQLQACCSSYILVRTDKSEIISPRHQKEIMSISDLAWGCFVSPGSTLVCARSLFDEIGPLDVSLRRLEDWDWLLRLTRSRELGFLEQPLARIHASGGGKTHDVLDALAQIVAKNSALFSTADRRHFDAAVSLERAAAYSRGGQFTSALLSILHSLWLAPAGNLALASVIHNRRARA